MTERILRRPLIAGLLVSAATIVNGQTSTSSSYEPELTSILMEAKVDLANIKLPASSAGALAQLAPLVSSGLVEFRSRIDTYDSISRTMRVTLYITPPSTPLPAPAASLPDATAQTMISQSTVRAEVIYHSKGTPLAIGMAGRFVAFLGGALAVAPGTPFFASFAYPPEALGAGGSSSATFGELTFIIPGQINLYSTAPAGSITVTPPAS